MSEPGLSRPVTPPRRAIPDIDLQLTPEQARHIELNRLKGAVPSIIPFWEGSELMSFNHMQPRQSNERRKPLHRLRLLSI